MIVALGLSFAGSCKPEPVLVGGTTPEPWIAGGFARDWQAEAGEMRWRAATLVPIVLNIALGFALLAPSRGVATIVDGPPRYCRGDGPEASWLPQLLLAGPIPHTGW